MSSDAPVQWMIPMGRMNTPPGARARPFGHPLASVRLRRNSAARGAMKMARNSKSRQPRQPFTRFAVSAASPGAALAFQALALARPFFEGWLAPALTGQPGHQQPNTPTSSDTDRAVPA